MRLIYIYLFFCFLSLPIIVYSQVVPQKVSVQQYISNYKDIAIRKMRDHKIPASITLAQGILESCNGNSDLAVLANNHFGIKCHTDWKGDSLLKDDDEKNECFRKYKTAEESFEDHSRFLSSRSRYAFLFTYNTKDYKSWAYGLKKAGYATNPHYPEKLIKIIEENRLYEFDNDGVILPPKDFAFSVDSLPAQYKELTAHDEFSEIVPGQSQRKIWKNNGIKFTLAIKGDDVEKLAIYFDLMTWQIYRYNEIKKNERLFAGQIIYLQPKKRKAEKEYHLVKPHESMYSISQLYGIKLKHLYRKNHMVSGKQPIVGEKLWLRKSRPGKRDS